MTALTTLSHLRFCNSEDSVQCLTSSYFIKDLLKYSVLNVLNSNTLKYILYTDKFVGNLGLNL